MELLSKLRETFRSYHVFEEAIESLQCDYEIENNGTIDELYTKIDNIFVSRSI